MCPNEFCAAYIDLLVCRRWHCLREEDTLAIFNSSSHIADVAVCRAWWRILDVPLIKCCPMPTNELSINGCRQILRFRFQFSFYLNAC